MREEKFKVIQFIRELILAIDKQLDNFSKKDIELKNRIRTNSYDILEIAYLANITEKTDKKKELILLMISKIKIIDFLLNMSFDKQLITNKKYIKLGEKIDDIAKYANGWIKSIKDI